MADSITLAHSCLLSLLPPSEVHHFAVTVQHMETRGVDNLQIEGLQICVVLCVRMKAWRDVK